MKHGYEMNITFLQTQDGVRRLERAVQNRLEDGGEIIKGGRRPGPPAWVSSLTQEACREIRKSPAGSIQAPVRNLLEMSIAGMTECRPPQQPTIWRSGSTARDPGDWTSTRAEHENKYLTGQR